MANPSLRPFMAYGILILFASLLSGCTQDGGGGYASPRNLTPEDLAPFVAAGCHDGADGFLDCGNATFRSQFDCFPSALQILGDGLSLEPGLVLAWCPVEVYRNNLSESDMGGFFYCGGGMLRTCTSYVYYDGSEMVQIRNSSGLAALAAPITSESEALAFVVLSKDVMGMVERESLPALRAGAKRNDSGYVVTAYYFSQFGCYDKIDYEEVTFFLTAEGEIRELGRKVAYTRHLDGMICVD